METNNYEQKQITEKGLDPEKVNHHGCLSLSSSKLLVDLSGSQNDYQVQLMLTGDSQRLIITLR
jgi:hypothetical protein